MKSAHSLLTCLSMCFDTNFKTFFFQKLSQTIKFLMDVSLHKGKARPKFRQKINYDKLTYVTDKS